MWRALADFVYPEACIGCSLRARGGLCRECLARMPRLSPHTCLTCGGAVPVSLPRCRECRGRAFAFDSATQCTWFESTAREAVLRLKYRGERNLADAMALLVAEALAPLAPAAITWVPGGKRRLRERGFDHAALLASSAARQFGLAASGLLVRARETPPQVGLAPEVRRGNVAGAFICKLPAPREVVVVDDVFTTGASASEAARALKEAGSERVVALAFSRTRRERPPSTAARKHG